MTKSVAADRDFLEQHQEHLRPGSLQKKILAAVVPGMAERIRMRLGRIERGSAVARVVEIDECYHCGEPLPDRAASGVRHLDEFVFVHRSKCAEALRSNE